MWSFIKCGVWHASRAGRWSCGALRAENIKRKKHSAALTIERFFSRRAWGVKLSTSDSRGNLFLLAGLFPKAESSRGSLLNLLSVGDRARPALTRKIPGRMATRGASAENTGVCFLIKNLRLPAFSSFYIRNITIYKKGILYIPVRYAFFSWFYSFP